MLFRVSIVFALLHLVALPVLAQVNIEALRRDDVPPGLSGSVGGTMAIQTGNVDLVQVALNGRVYRLQGSTTTMLVGNGGLGLLGGSRFSSSGLLHLRQSHLLEEWFASEWYTQLNYDKAQLLGFRAVAGGGGRLRVARGEWGTAWGGTGLMLEHERLSLPITAMHPRRTTVLRWSSFASVRAATPSGVVVTSTTYVQPLPTNSDDIRILENLAVAAPVASRLALTVAFDLRYDSRPPDGIASLDTRLRTGVTMTF